PGPFSFSASPRDKSPSSETSLHRSFHRSTAGYPPGYGLPADREPGPPGLLLHRSTDPGTANKPHPQSAWKPLLLTIVAHPVLPRKCLKELPAKARSDFKPGSTGAPNSPAPILDAEGARREHPAKTPAGNSGHHLRFESQRTPLRR